MRSSAKLSVLTAALVLAVVGCGDDDPASPRTVSFEVTLQNLPPLAAGKGHYEAWIAFADEGKRGPAGDREGRHGDLELISLGTFQVGSGGALVELDGQPATWGLRIERDPQHAAEAWISIEPEADAIPDSAAGLLVAGEFIGSETRGVAEIHVGYATIFDRITDLNLAAITGRYTLESPSDADTTNEAQGIYFRNGNDHGLDLPTLDGERVVYEGWIETIAGGTFRSTGRFTEPHGFDSDSAGFGGGGVLSDPHPGQEFVTGSPLVLDTGGSRVLVSMEPTNDNDPAAPTSFVLFSATIGNGQATGVPVLMQNVTNALPTGTIVINR